MNTITIVQGKTKEKVEFPLLPDIGNALIDYLKYGRPQNESKYVFLSHSINSEKLAPPTLHSIVAENLRKADIKGYKEKKHGPHALRHSLASELLKQDTSLPIISTVLGHQSTETTKIYLSVDVESLRVLTLPIPKITSPYYTSQEEKS